MRSRRVGSLVRAVSGFAAAGVIASCGGVPLAPTCAHAPEDFVPAPSPPPPPAVARIPATRARGAVWVDGDVVPEGDHYRARPGRFVVLGPGEAIAPLAVRRTARGLEVAPATLCTPRGRRPAPLEPEAPPPAERFEPPEPDHDARWTAPLGSVNSPHEAPPSR